MIDKEWSKRRAQIVAIKKKLGKQRVGLPSKVIFEYDKGAVTCYPKEKKWVIVLLNNDTFTHFVSKRNNVTKFTSRLFLKFCLSGIWKPDKQKFKSLNK